MVYESDFYTTRRPYRASPSVSSYTISKREIPWEKVPFVPRPSLVPDPVTAYGKRQPHQQQQEKKKQERKFILSAEERAKIKPKAFLEPVKPYVSARENTRDKVLLGILRTHTQPNAESMDYVLPRLHKVAECPDLPYKRRMVSASDMPPSPRHYVVTDTPDRRNRSAEQVYSYSYNSSSDSSRHGDPYSSPVQRSYASSESVTRSSTGGPGGYNYSTERSSRTRGDGPGGYSSSYSSTTSGRLPGGTSYRHYSYRV